MADLLNMHDGMMSYEEIDEMMLENTVIHGPNMWILCLAALIASIGLKMNSTAVIIGAIDVYKRQITARTQETT